MHRLLEKEFNLLRSSIVGLGRKDEVQVPGIGVINNPHSRKNRKNPEWMHSLGYIVGTTGTSVATEQINDVDEMARLFCEQDVDILAINGGDGSNSVALSSIIKAYDGKTLPKIALLRGGTMNIAANSCGIKGTPGGLMINLVNKYREGLPFETTWRDTLKIEDRYGFVFGNGFIHDFLEELYKKGKSAWGAAKLLSRGVASSVVGGKFSKAMFKGVSARITVDGKVLPYENLAAMAASTVAQIGLNFKAFHRWNEKPYTFHLIAVLCSPFTLASSFPKIYFGKKISDEKMLDMVASELILETEGTMGYTLDGENFKAENRLVVTTGPRLEIIVK